MKSIQSANSCLEIPKASEISKTFHINRVIPKYVPFLNKTNGVANLFFSISVWVCVWARPN